MSRRGATLPELLLALLILAILAAIAVPRLAAVLDAAAVRVARGELLVALDAARGAALRLDTDVELRDDGLRRMLVPALPDSTVTWIGPAASRHGVVLGGLATPITFGPAGIAVGTSNRTLSLTRGRVTMTVVLSRLGRVR
jgi:prepilin-type N-terminal cleavage/methylation domain-containing protein